jgi:glycosyltransferase involved in cell wall biosynthesis
MSGPLPMVSVVIPVYNGGRRLPEAVASVERQVYRPIEVIVVDDGSTDDTPDVIRGLGNRVRAIRQENSGPAAARNRGLAAAEGEIIGFLDCDDLWPDGRLHGMVGRLRDDPSLDVVLGRTRFVSESGYLSPELRWEDREERTIVIPHVGCAVYRRSAFDTAGRFDESLRFSEDQDWYLRAREVGLQIRIIPDVTLVYRLHDQNMTRGKGMKEMLLVRALKMSLDRRRASGRAELDLADWRAFDERLQGERRESS